MLGPDNRFDFELFLPFNQVRGRFRIVWAIDFVFLIGRESTSMEDIVNMLPAIRQFQLKVDSSNCVNNFKWPKMFGSEFLLEPRPNTCFTRGPGGLSSGTLMIWTQTILRYL